MTDKYWAEEKDPADVDYWDIEVDDTWLDTDTITNAQAVVVEGPGNLNIGNVGSDSNLVRIQLSDGNVGTHGIKVTITTNTGRIKEQTFYLVVKEK